VRRTAFAVTLSLVMAGCGSSENTTVPPVDTRTLGSALDKIHAAGLKADVPAFGPVTWGTPLDGAGVGDQDPEPGTKVAKGSTVHLTIGFSPIPSPVVGKNWPRWLVVPDLVGLSWPDAARRLTGLWPVIASVDPLPAAKSELGMRAYVITGQLPGPGKRVPYGGKRVGRGWRPTQIRLTVGVAD
jgi:hypothetical protein